MQNTDHTQLAKMQHALAEWFSHAARDLPWRATAERRVDAWAVLVSEFMLQQTQVERVVPRFLEWLARWPSPAALAAEEPGEAVRAWGRLGYPRRALWLHAAATQIAADYSDQVPHRIDELLSLKGVGPYTARAVATFAFGERHAVVDTNTRRVIARAVHGKAAAGMPHSRDLDDMMQLLPEDAAAAQIFNASMMELGATVCTARAPGCGECPIAYSCEWRRAGFPDNAPERRPRQAAFEGSDRQVRGRIMALLRGAQGPVSRGEALLAASEGKLRDPLQPERALSSLVTDGLIVQENEALRLP